MGNLKGQLRDKPFRDAIRIEATLAENGEETPANPGSLRYIARQLLKRAGDDTVSAREVADRLDGKAAQVIEDSQGNELQFLGEQEMTVEFTRLIQDLNLGETTKLTVRKHVKAPRKLNGHSED